MYRDTVMVGHLKTGRLPRELQQQQDGLTRFSLARSFIVTAKQLHNARPP